MTKLQQSWVQSQHPPTQWNVGGGRGSSAYIKIKIKSKNSPLKKASNMDVQDVSISTASSIDVHGVSLSTASITDVLSVSLSTASSMDVQGVSLYTNSSMDAEGVTLLNARMSDCSASSQSGTGMKRNAFAGISPVPE
jgi:hypothetical protein